jgi:Ca2+-binding RTX toxin-like protein
MAITFNESYYLQTNPDVALAVSLRQFASGADHFNKLGANELRNPNAVFDSKYYAAQNPDVLTAVSAKTYASVYAHYLANGMKEGRAPNASLKGFDGADYIAKNPDVATAGFTAATALQHYVQYGVDENRSFTSSTAGAVTGNVSGTTGDDTVTPAGGQASTVRVEGGQQAAAGDTLVITSGSASSFQVIDLSNNGGDQNQTRDNTTNTNAGAKVGPVVQGFENVDARQATINMNITAIDRTSVTNTGSVASAQTGSVLQGGTGRDTLAGNAGNDSIVGNDGNDQITGAAGNDSLSGGVGDDNIGGGAGADVISDGAGNDTVTGDAGADVITVDAGTNSVDAGADNDTITLSADQATSTTVSTISGGSGDDTITLSATAITAASRSSVSGGSGNDTITAGLGVETVNAGAGNDTVKFTSTNLGATDVFNGNDGQDIIQLEIPTGSGTNTFVFAPVGTTNATTQFAGFEAIALIDSSGNTNAKQYKINLTDTFVANNLVNGSFLIDARGLPGGSNLVIDFSGLTAASAARFTAGAFRVLTSPSTDVRDQNNVTITAAYSVQTGNSALNNVTGFSVYSGDTTITAGTAAAYNTDRTVNTGTGQATFTTTGGTAEVTSGTTTYNFTQTTGTAATLTTALNNGFGSGFLTTGADLINSSTFLSATTVVFDATTGDGDRLDATLTAVVAAGTSITNIETLNISSFGGGMSFAAVTGATAINITGTSFAATGVASGSTFNLNNIFGAQSYTLGANAASQSITLNLGTIASGTAFSFSDSVGAIETVNLNLSANTTATLTTLTAASTVNLTGTGNMTLTSNDATASTFNASTLTGVFAYTQAAAANVSIVGSTGNDTFSFNSTGTLTTNDTINGGTGTDTVNYSGNLAANGLDSVSNVEVLNLTGTGANTYTTVDALVAFGQTLTVNASGVGSLTWNGAAETNGVFSITASAGADVITGSANADTIVANNGADTISGGLGADAITLTETTAATDIVILTTGGAVAVDSVTGFAVGATNGDRIDIDLSDLNALVGDMRLAGTGTGALAADATPTVTIVTGAYDLGTVAASDILSISSGTAFTTTTLARALETGGALALTVNAAWAAGDAFTVVWDDNVNTYISYVTTTAGAADNALFTANDLTVTNIATLVGVADASTFLTNNVTIIA